MQILNETRYENIGFSTNPYRGTNIKQSIHDFISASGCSNKDSILVDNINLGIGGEANLIAYIGHNGLMEFAWIQFLVQNQVVIRMP